MRLVLWGGALVVILVAYLVAANLRMGHQVIACFDRLKGSHEKGSARGVAGQLVACLDRETGWIEKPLLYWQKRPIVSAEPVPCKYVGEWKATRDPNLVYAMTLAADGSFVARPVVSPDMSVITGVWMVHGSHMAWLYDNMPTWPPDANPIRDESDTGFSLIERDRSVTRYQRVSRGQCPR